MPAQVDETKPVNRYILLTQCLQNDFFTNPESGLCLPAEVRDRILKGKRPKEAIANGPLGSFLRALVEPSPAHARAAGRLFIVNIRDWHEHDRSYDKERLQYGPHCEARSPGAAYIDGLERWLDPGRGANGPPEGSYYSSDDGAVQVFHVLSNSLFDFKRHSSGSRRRRNRKLEPSPLEQLLDVLVTGTEEEVDELCRHADTGAALTVPSVQARLSSLTPQTDPPAADDHRVYMAVIGAYTDIKVRTLLGGICAAYEFAGLAVSDTLTVSSSVERHLGALDFVSRVLGIEVIHGLNDLIRYLGGERFIENEDRLVDTEPFTVYANYFQDKQNLLAQQATRLREYVELTQRRHENVYGWISFANRFLFGTGATLLTLAVIGLVARVFAPDAIGWEAPLIAGGLSLTQVVGLFITRPMGNMLKNLTSLAAFKMVIESHSLKAALARYHLTTPQTLRENLAAEPQACREQIDLLEEQLKVLGTLAEQDLDALTKLGLVFEGGAEPLVPPADGEPSAMAPDSTVHA